MNKDTAHPIPFDKLNTEQLELDNPFWQFSLNQWKNNSLRLLLLKLQDEKSHQINLLLFLLWLGHEKKRINARDYKEICHAVNEWHTLVVAPLRNTRKCLPPSLQQSDLKTQIQRSELQAEQYEQAMLYRCSSNLKNSGVSKLNTLDALVRSLSTSTLEKSDLLLLVKACLPAHPESHILKSIEAEV